jgi:hypothetical protein
MLTQPARRLFAQTLARTPGVRFAFHRNTMPDVPSTRPGLFHAFRCIGSTLPALALVACGGAAAVIGPSDSGASPDVDAGGAAFDGSNPPADAGADVLGDRPDASSDATASDNCTSAGSVTFRMRPPSADAGYSFASSFGIPGDGVWWYSVATADGGALQIFPSETTCGTCAQVANPIGQACEGLSADGVTATWSGIAVTGQSMCSWSPGDGEPLETIPCDTARCVPSGRYVVTMCAGGSLACSDTPTCVSTPFDYPSTSEIVGTLP